MSFDLFFRHITNTNFTWLKTYLIRSAKHFALANVEVVVGLDWIGGNGAVEPFGNLRIAPGKKRRTLAVNANGQS